MTINNQRGFTIIEIICVIAVLGILAAMALPKLDTSLNNRDLDNDTRILKANITEFRQYALNAGSSSADCTITINSDGYAIKTYSSGKLIIEKQISFSKSVTATAATIRFNANGQPCDATGKEIYTDTTIKLSNGKETRTVEVTQLTGRVTQI